MPSPEDRAFQNRIAEMARRENALRDEQWRIQQRQEGHAKCLSTPRACGIGIFNTGQRMAAWDRTGGKVIQQEVRKQRSSGGGVKRTGYDVSYREVRPHRSEKHGWDDSTKTKKEMEIMLFGKEKWERDQRGNQISGELKALKAQRDSAVDAENTRKIKLIETAHKQHRAKLAADIKIAKRKASHPANTTTRPPSRRHKSGARSRYVPPPRRSSRR